MKRPKGLKCIRHDGRATYVEEQRVWGPKRSGHWALILTLFRVRCDSCLLMTEWSDTLEGAVAVWNEAQEVQHDE